ncbi:MAG: hypothetical protein ACOYBT_10345 [Polynucleobacter sp.]
MSDASDSDSETLQVQVENAKQTRKKGLPAHKETGKKVQAMGVEARKKQAAASKREKEVEKLMRRNDQLEKLNKIAELEHAEKERAELLKQNNREKSAAASSNKPSAPVADGDINARFARLEELIMARQSEAPTPKPKAKRAPKKPAAPVDSDSDDEAPPRQKAVGKSARHELRKKAGAEEEQLNKRGHLVGNKGKAKAMELDQERQYMEIANQLMPGRF